MTNPQLELAVSKFVKERVNLDPSSFHIVSFSNKGDIGEGSLFSTKPVFFVKDSKDALLYVVKAHPLVTENVDAFFLLSTLQEQLARLPLKKSKIIAPFVFEYYMVSGEAFLLVGMAAAQGESLAKHLDRPPKSEAERVMRKIAEAFADLHTFKPSPAFSDQYWALDRLILESFLKLMQENPSAFAFDPKKLKQKFSRLYESANLNPSFAGLIHGDPTIHNLIYDPAQDVVSMIDTTGMPFFEGFLAGPTARDYVFFLLSFKQIALLKGLSDEEIARLSEIFMESYAKYAPNAVPSAENIRYYTLIFWMRKLDLYMHLPSFDNPLTAKQIAQMQQLALEQLAIHEA